MLRLTVWLLLGITLTTGQDAPAGCPAVDCSSMDCAYGLQKDLNGCTICTCIPEACQDIECPMGKVCDVTELQFTGERQGFCSDPKLPTDCRLLADKGPCRAFKERWFYNNEKDMCESFTYGGCQGNQNNFEQEAECSERCRPENRMVDRNGCSLAACYMMCPYGFKKDGSGCDMCECYEPSTLDCPSFEDCSIECENGRQLDETGCPLCACVQFSSNVIPEGCPPLHNCNVECPQGHALQVNEGGCPTCECVVYNDEMYYYYYHNCEEASHHCDLKCQFGYELDEDECPICQCRTDPGCEAIACTADVCPHGRKMDNRGCETCECRSYDECHSDHPCQHLFCKYDFQRDEFGCNMCFCHDPCYDITCESHTECDVIHNMTTNLYTGHCVPDIESHQWCDLLINCEIYCANGFVMDKVGCPTCACLDEPRADCQADCEMFCPYGRAYDRTGCRLCECLPDPCRSVECEDKPDGQHYVCETMPSHDCDNCPATATCIGVHAVKRARIQFNLVHPPVADLKRKLVAEELILKVSDLTGIEEDYIIGVRVEPLARSVTRVVFHIVAKDDENLEQALFVLKDSITSSSLQLEAQEMTFEPEAGTVSASFSTDSEIWEDEPVGEDDMADPFVDTQTIIIISAAIAGAILLVAIVFIVRACKRTNKPSGGASYSKAAQSETVRMGGDNIYKKPAV